MNKFMVTGRLTSDPVERATKEGNPIISFRIAVDRWGNGQKVTDFFSCTAFSRQAETLKKLTFGKGAKVLVVGQMQIDSYTDRNGNTRETPNIVVNEFELLESRGGSQAPAGTVGGARVPNQWEPAAKQMKRAAQESIEDFEDLDDEEGDLPF